MLREFGFDYQGRKIINFKRLFKASEYSLRSMVVVATITSLSINFAAGCIPRGADRHIFSMRKANEREKSRMAPLLDV